MLNDLLILIIAYLLGCVSTAYYLVRWRTGQDVRTLGSGNAGATNAGRVLGKWGFGVAMVGDVGKGVMAVLIARWLGGGEWAVALAVPVVVVGHIWPVQLRFRGGEGFATAFGAVLVYDPPVARLIGGIALILYLLTRSRAIAGAIALLAVPLTTLALNRPTSEVMALLLVVGMMLWTFRRHLRTLRKERIKSKE
jgi:acyl phosphate:glycerol-3-phosphate acyltransferase